MNGRNRDKGAEGNNGDGIVVVWCGSVVVGFKYERRNNNRLFSGCVTNSGLGEKTMDGCFFIKRERHWMEEMVVDRMRLRAKKGGLKNSIKIARWLCFWQERWMALRVGEGGRKNWEI
ncbi:unnamed protein product [Dovyalis caffra]|uniref:Uncharacterized protein n=1 Tax=Dovyalis caffra TaxID=77055 RepID=A0AAV1R4J4_9ROSI|nr:unnamed protein product [Dovyalis caffra]